MTSRWKPCAVCLIALCVVAALAAKKKPDDTDAALQQKCALHALNRLTFGPRLGDVATVTSIGVDQWIEIQLHPERINNSAIQGRLAQYRTLDMSSRELALSFPSNPILKAVQDGKLQVPNDPYKRAVYQANLARLQDKQEKKQAQGGNAPTQPASVKPASVQMLPQANDNRVASRTIVDELVVLAPPARMQRILALSPAGQSVLTKDLPQPKRQALLAGLTPEQRETVLALSSPQAVVEQEVQSAKLLRAVYSDRQLEEVLTDLWFNHFNVYINKGGERYLVTPYERDVIRPHVLGKFKDLLLATAQSPAMLFYLDNWQSVGPHSDAALGTKSHPGSAVRPRWVNGPFGPHPLPSTKPVANSQQKRRSGLNENYARELMELHTLGVNGGYTQKDVTEVARVFTGWTLEEPREGGGFVFRPRMHEPGEKVVLGHKIKDNGEKEGIQVLEMLARQPATARFISTKLAQRFVSDNPPPRLIAAMSKTYLKTDGDLREVMRTMFHSAEFWADDTYNAKVKTPFEFVVSSLRATNADVSDPRPLLQALNRMGMPLYGMQPPIGYSSQADVWVNSAALLERMNFSLALVNGKIAGTQFDATHLAPLPADVAADPYQIQLALEQSLLSGQVSAQTHQVIEQQVMASTGPPIAPSSAQMMPVNPAAGSVTSQPSSLTVIAALLLGSPEFQRR